MKAQQGSHIPRPSPHHLLLGCQEQHIVLEYKAPILNRPGLGTALAHATSLRLSHSWYNMQALKPTPLRLPKQHSGMVLGQVRGYRTYYRGLSSEELISLIVL